MQSFNREGSAMKMHVIVVLLLALGVAATSDAQIVKKAQVGFRFLENPVSADAIGRGGIGVAVPMGSNGVFWNPALLGWMSATVEGSLHHTEGIADINYNAASGAVRFGDFGVVGVSLLMMDYGKFRGTRVAPFDPWYVETGTFTPFAYSLGLAFSQRVSERFSYGVHVKLVDQYLGRPFVAPPGASITDPNLPIRRKKYEHWELAADVGALYDFHYNGIRFGACLQNISREVKYEEYSFPLPFAVSFGATIEPLLFFLEPDANQVFILSFESRHPRDYREKLKFGGEFWYMQLVALRLGYMSHYDEQGFTAGLGIHHNLGDVPLTFDYAYQPFGVFGAVHHFTIGASY